MSATRPAGLYRTVLPLPGNEAQVPAQRLVLFHPASDSGVPAVVLPNGLTDNRWAFGNRGFAVNDARWPETLVALPPQGFYTLKTDLTLTETVKLPAGVLVQLGYTQQGDGVLFPGYLIPGNTIQFEKTGARVSDLQLDAFKAIDFRLLVRAPAESPAPAADGNGSAVH